jgi:hypothetical protein
MMLHCEPNGFGLTLKPLQNGILLAAPAALQPDMACHRGTMIVAFLACSCWFAALTTNAYNKEYKYVPKAADAGGCLVLQY